ncbi:hypothetical protein BVC80_9093g145 [Macleaya cordata]|uniref:Uncharacterized protein n=1 Tax=Macleaya cordata TaxID=56857 RepID=A0A200PX39_MACCD|nr:hypothetical protein BVC80_9093g145 [Macleaya cordata]
MEISGERHGLVNLYKDMESCKGYPDIQVMWEMLQSSSCPPHTNTNIININNTTSKRCSSWSWRFCFKPT